MSVELLARRAIRSRTPPVLRRAYARRLSRDADRSLHALAAGSEPIVAGPWSSELGFELLYWIPLLRWLTTELGVDPARLVAISRGGAASWYEGVAGRYVELYDHLEPAELARQRDGRLAAAGTEKQLSASPAERALVANVLGAAASPAAKQLHPSLMYRLFNPSWLWGSGDAAIAARTRHAPLRVGGATGRTPERPYVVVKAYHSACFPASDENREFVRTLVRGLAERTRVVVLCTPAGIDEHADAAACGNERIVEAAPELHARDNLAVQSRLVRDAEALVSTYGGFAYLGPYLGTPTYSFYSRPGFDPAHLRAIERVAATLEPDRRLFSARPAADFSLDDVVPPAGRGA